jgi:hypothetical protein
MIETLIFITALHIQMTESSYSQLSDRKTFIIKERDDLPKMVVCIEYTSACTNIKQIVINDKIYKMKALRC